MGGGRARASLGLLLLLLLWSRSGDLAQAQQNCQNGVTFFNSTTGKCKPCRTCEGVWEYKQRCLEATDAICQCTSSYRCGDGKVCKACRCARGEEMLEQGCQRCPEGTFNDQAGKKCRPWTKCPGNKILANGTRTTDVRCHVASEGTTLPSAILVDISPAVTERDGQLLTVSIALTAALLLCVLSLLILFITFRAWAQRKLPAVFVKQPLGQLAQEVDDCSCRYPEEEEGGSEGLKGELLEKYP